MSYELEKLWRRHPAGEIDPELWHRRPAGETAEANCELPRSDQSAIRNPKSEILSEQVRRMNEVQVGLTLLCTQAAPPDLLARANGRALRMLRRASRVSAAAERLLRVRPNLSRWQRAQLHLARVSIGAAAALLMLVVRAGLLNGFENTRQLGELLAEKHWQRLAAAAPDEWMGPRT